MDKQKQYDNIVEMLARVRMLSAHSDNAIVLNNAIIIKTYGIIMANAIGFKDDEINSDSIKRYHELNDDYVSKNENIV